MEKKFVSAAYLAEMLGFSRTYIYMLTRENEIPHYRVKKNFRYDLEEIQEWLKSKS